MNSTYLQTQFAKYCLRSFGEGKLIFLLPGWPLSGRIFEVLKPHCPPGYRIVSLDLPGWAGESEFIGHRKASVTNYLSVVQGAYEALVKKEGNPVLVGGISAGGILSLLLSLEYPDSVKKIFVQSSPFRADCIIYRGGKLLPLASRVRDLPLGKTLVRVVYVGITLSGYFKFKDRFGPDLREGLQSDFRNLNFDCALDFALDFHTQDFSSRFEIIKQAVTVIGCQEDGTVSFECMKKLAEEILPRAEVVSVPNVGHSFLVEEPELFMKELLKAAGG